MEAPETIVAAATPAGYSGIAVVRIGGKDALSRAQEMLPGIELPLVPNHSYYGRLVDPQQADAAVDWVRAVFFFAPDSYTGDDLVEISCHGNPLIVDRVIRICLSRGCRIAEPGEFTRRAVLNGKIDLIQAEAVMDAVHASCDEARRLAISQYEGKLSEKVHRFRTALTDMLVEVEANIDFGDEEGLDYDPERMSRRITALIGEIDDLLAAADTGIRIREGFRVAIVGRTNVGKSTLFNRLLGYDRALVHGTAGTTRDYLEEGVEIAGLYLRLIDTAGFLKDGNELDALSSGRSRQIIGQSDLAVLLFDSAEPLNEEDIRLYNSVKDKLKILVINKIDLNRKLQEQDILSDSIKLSAKTGENIDALKEKIKNLLKHESIDRPILLTRYRHISALKDLRFCLANCRENPGPETVAFELHSGLEIIGELTGKVMRREILDRIFEEFCIGK